MQEERLGSQEVEGDTHSIDEGDRPEGSTIAQVLGNDATQEDAQLLEQVEQAKQVISGVRAVRQSKNISPREPLELEVVVSGDEDYRVTRCPALGAVIRKLAGLSDIRYVQQKGDGSSAFLIGTDEYAVPLGNLIDAEAEIARMEKELKAKEGFLKGVLAKLNNERFVANAPEAVVALERKKQHDAESIIASLKESIAALRK